MTSQSVVVGIKTSLPQIPWTDENRLYMCQCVAKTGAHLNSKLWKSTADMFFKHSQYLTSLYIRDNDVYTRRLSIKTTIKIFK